MRPFMVAEQRVPRALVFPASPQTDWLTHGYTTALVLFESSSQKPFLTPLAHRALEGELDNTLGLKSIPRFP